MFDITTGQSQQVATHEGPIKSIKWVETPNGGILATGSWDKTLKVSATPHPLVKRRIDKNFSIGTCALRIPSRPSNYPNDAIQWMSPIRYSLSAPPNARSGYLTWRTPPYHTRLVDHHLDAVALTDEDDAHSPWTRP